MNNFGNTNPNNQNWQTGNGNNNNYAGYPYMSYPAQMSQPTTNIIYVTSPEEALMRSNVRNSDMVYFDQDRSVFYRVKVDMDGRKSWAPFPFILPEQSNNAPATKADIQILSDRLTALENAQAAKVAHKDKPRERRENPVDREVNKNAESHG